MQPVKQRNTEDINEAANLLDTPATDQNDSHRNGTGNFYSLNLNVAKKTETTNPTYAYYKTKQQTSAYWKGMWEKWVLRVVVYQGTCKLNSDGS